MLTPRPYQIVGRDFLAGRRHALLADEMRVGKTPQAILAAQKVGAQKVLVVCPAIAVAHWEREFVRWWPQDTVALVRSYDRAKLQWDSLTSQRWDVTIVDEAHFAKNPEAQRTKLVYGKNGLGWCSDRLWALSGTPAPKHAGELWPMLRAFGVVEMTYAEFVGRYCTVNPLTLAITGTHTDMIPELRALLDKVMLRRKRKDVAPDMPDIDFNFLEVTPTAKVDLKIPAGLSDAQLDAWLESQQAVDKEDRVAVALAKVGPLADEIEFAIHNNLLDRTVAFGWHIEPLKALVRSLMARDIRAELIIGATSQTEREGILQRLRDGTTQVVVANILAAGTAVDMSSASHAFMLELDWVSGNNVQAANRLISMEKTEKVTVDVVTWPGSADDRVQKVLLRRVAQLATLY